MTLPSTSFCLRQTKAEMVTRQIPHEAHASQVSMDRKEEHVDWRTHGEPNGAMEL